MSAFNLRRFPPVLLACAATFLNSKPALACAVCFGSPDSSLTQGAKAGILILLGVVATVLTWIVAVALFWIRRARTLQEQSALHLEYISSMQGPLQVELSERNGRYVAADVEG